MPSAYNEALAANLARVSEERGVLTRRQLKSELESSGKAFRPTYTVLQRIADGTRAMRAFELAAIAAAVGADPLDIAPETTRRPVAAAARQATLDLTVEQIVGLAEALGLDPQEFLSASLAAIKPIASSAAAQRTRRANSATES